MNTIQPAIDVLNKMFAVNPAAIDALFEVRVPGVDWHDGQPMRVGDVLSEALEAVTGQRIAVILDDNTKQSLRWGIYNSSITEFPSRAASGAETVAAA